MHRARVVSHLATASRPVEVVAHRGASAEYPEHSMTAYRHAVRLGADAVECDVRMTRDGALVCVHDRRIDRTSTGRGVVAARDLADLERFSFGRPAPASPRAGVRRLPGPVEERPVDDDSGRLLTLDRLLEYVTATDGSVRLAIETKHPTRHSSRVEAALVATLRRFGLVRGDRPVEWSGRSAVRVMSFSPVALRRVRLLAPGVPTVHLVRQPVPWVRGGRQWPAGSALGPSIEMLRRDPGLVARAHRAGLELHVWTVNRAEDMECALSLGVDAVITDHPGTLLRMLGRHPGGADRGTD